jgi:hypothetical protein
VIWGWVHLATCLLLGYALVRLLPLRFHLPELASAVCLVGLLVGTVVTVASVSLLGYGAGPACAIAAMIAVAVLAFARRSGESA